MQQYQTFAGGYGTFELDKLEEKYAGFGGAKPYKPSDSYLTQLWSFENEQIEKDIARAKNLYKQPIFKVDDVWGDLYDVVRRERGSSKIDQEFRCDDRDKLAKKGSRGIAKEKDHTFDGNR